jgi:phospholipid/cholesterol/gamma-HCH transport system substrate-binding protein
METLMTREQKVGLFFLIGLVLLFLAVELTVGTGLFRSRYHLWVEYRDVQGLNIGDPVRLAGVKKGTIDDIVLAPDHVRVRMRLDTDAAVRRDSVARLDLQALSASRFISISLGSPAQPLLEDGDTVAGEEPPGITDMISQLDGVAESVQDLAVSFNRNQEELLRNLNDLIVENRNSLNAMLANVASITAKLDRGDGTLGLLLNDPALYAHADRVLAEAEQMMTDLQEITARLARGEGSLGRLVSEDALYDEVRETVASLNVTARNLEAVSNDVRDGRGTLGRLVADESLYVEAQDAVRGLDRATAGIEDQAPISVLGTFVSTLF